MAIFPMDTTVVKDTAKRLEAGAGQIDDIADFIKNKINEVKAGPKVDKIEKILEETQTFLKNTTEEMRDKSYKLLQAAIDIETESGE